ncbi:right-handed parallel beta-helix repeat-containing protein [Streptomyces sp. NBC_01602]|uniref:right-handed parallel beta-helix repeat-containing protein n=1 Tax=Streptomyces sp. NBC_01602 TaxID=2975893 RepID=UPI0038704EE4
MSISLIRSKAAVTVLAAAVSVTGLLPAAASAPEGPGRTSGTTYYVDCLRGSDQASGTNSGTAWRTLTKASRAYEPGDRLLLRRGRTCTGVLAPTGSGTAAEPISVDAYGKGAKPHIEGEGDRAAVYLVNVEGWELRNLDISNTGPHTTTDRRAGLLVRLTDHGVGSHYVVDGVDVHDVDGADFKDPDPSGGILFSVTGSAVPTRFDGVRIEDSTVRRTDRTGIGTSSSWGRRAEHPNGPGTSWEAITGLRIQRNKVYDVGGDGIVVQTAKGALVEHNYVNGFNMRSAGYNAGIWAWNSDDVLYQYNEVTGGHGTLDSMAYDIDGGNNRNVYQYNYSHDNEGGFLLICNGGRTRPSSPTTARPGSPSATTSSSGRPAVPRSTTPGACTRTTSTGARPSPSTPLPSPPTRSSPRPPRPPRATSACARAPRHSARESRSPTESPATTSATGSRPRRTWARTRTVSPWLAPASPLPPGRCRCPGTRTAP